MSRNTFHELPWDIQPGAPLAPWAYTNPEVFELDYEAFFLRRWQFIGHVNELLEEGSFIAHDIGRDNVFVIRGKDGELRAFQNVCRHRASRVLEGKGTCKGVIRCPYHGWTYRLDGRLMSIPQDEHFPDVDKPTSGKCSKSSMAWCSFASKAMAPALPSISGRWAAYSKSTML